MVVWAVRLEVGHLTAWTIWEAALFNIAHRVFHGEWRCRDLPLLRPTSRSEKIFRSSHSTSVCKGFVTFGIFLLDAMTGHYGASFESHLFCFSEYWLMPNNLQPSVPRRSGLVLRRGCFPFKRLPPTVSCSRQTPSLEAIQAYQTRQEARLAKFPEV